MKTTITIQSAQGSSITITVEHVEPMNISTDLEAIEQRAEQGTSAQLQAVISEAAEPHTPVNQSVTETELTNSSKKKTCKWCKKPFVIKKRNDESYCSDHCKHEAKKEKGRVYKQRKNSLTNSHVAREYRGKNCSRCGRYYIPTGSRQDYCKPDCKPLTPAEHAELDATLKQIEANQKKTVFY